MTIAGRLRIAAIVPALAALMTIAALAFSHRATSQVQQKLRTARQLATGVDELNDLVRAYLLHRDERPVQQFHAALADLKKLLAGTRFGNPAQDRLRTSVGDAAGLMDDAFGRLTSETARSEAAGGTELAREAEERLSGQVLVRSREALSDVARLEGLLGDEAAAANRRTGFLVMTLVLAMAAVVTVILVPLTGGVTRSLARLAKGVEAVGSGDLSHRVGIHSIDEIGDVSRSFDMMAGRLQKTIVSRDALATEVEQRKQAEEALRGKEATLRSILDATKESVWLFSADGRILDVNDTAAARFGLTPAEVVGRRFQEILSPELAQSRLARIKQVEESRSPLEFADERDGRAFHHNFYPVSDATGQVTAVVSFSRDITERRQAEEALRANEKTFAELIERAPFGIYVVDSRFRIAHMNSSSQNGAFSHVRPLIGRDFSEAMRTLWPEPVAGEIIGHFRHTLETGEPYYSPQFTNPRADIAATESYEWELHRMTLPNGQRGVICYYFDSTKLREAEAALRESETKLRAAMESMQEAIFIADAEGRLTSYNEQFIRYHRFKDKQECSRKIDDCPRYLEAFLDGAPAPLEMWAMPRALRGETASNTEYMLRRKDTGETWWGSYSFGPIRDKSGRIIGAVVAARETTDLKKAEAALRESEAKASAMVKYAPTGIYELEFKGRKFISINDAMCRILGYTREELFALGPMGLLDDESRGRFADRVKRTLSGQKIDETVDYRVRRKDGSFIDAVLYVTFSAGGDRALVVAHDVTQRKRAEEELRRSRDEWERTFNSVPDLIAILDHEHRVVQVNKAMADKLGVTPEQAKGLHCYEAVHGTSMPPDFCPHALTCKDAKEHVAEVHEPRLGGDYLVSTTPVCDESGRLTGSVHVARDITERKRVEERNASQLAELQRWQAVMLNREDRVMALKREVNDLLRRQREPIRYPSQREPKPGESA